MVSYNIKINGYNPKIVKRKKSQQQHFKSHDLPHDQCYNGVVETDGKQITHRLIHSNVYINVD